MRRLLLAVVSVALAQGCAGADESKAPAPPQDAGSDVEAPVDDLCPDPDHPRVHYLSEDPNDCIGIELDCTTEQNGFLNECGCGCIDKGDPLCPPLTADIDWTSDDPAECDPEPPECPLGQYGFSNSCGCGCMTPGEG